MLNCILIAGMLYLERDGALYNFHHVTKFSQSRQLVYVDWGNISQRFRVPEEWQGGSVDQTLALCIESAEFKAQIAARASQ